MISFHDAGDTAQSYTAIVLSWIDHYDLMHIGATVLLIARLICDVPPAYQYLKSKFTKDKQ
jgi:hypothetical protein